MVNKIPSSIYSKGMIKIATGLNLKNNSRIIKVEDENIKQSDLSKIFKKYHGLPHKC